MAGGWDLLCVVDPLVRGLFIHIDVVFIYVYYVHLLLEEGWMSVSAFVSSRAPFPLVVSVVSRIWLSRDVMVHGDGFLYRGFGTDGYVTVVFLCVGDRLL
jgi:hypothetical protein